MKFWAEVFNFRIIAGGVYAVGEEDDTEVSDGICPDGCAGESERAKGLLGEVVTG